VTGLAVGDEVCGMTGASMGAHAELVAARANRVVVKPAVVTHDDAAAVLFGGTTALHYLRDKAGVRPGQSVLVIGASGAVGTNAVQLARHFGATVTGVTSGPIAALVSDLGAERVIDYTRTPLDGVTERFDVVLDTVGNVTTTSGKRLLNPGGVLLLAVADLWQTIAARGNVKAGPAPERVEDAELLLGLVADGTLKVVIDHAYELDAIVAAHERVDTGHKVGNVVVRP
jgi:NADPH:quinone reductase-like Zn-dependent oxidoreductase